MHGNSVRRWFVGNVVYIPQSGFFKQEDRIGMSLFFLEDVCQSTDQDPFGFSSGRSASAAPQPTARQVLAALFDVPDVALSPESRHVISLS
jgi:hypothetical protein